MRFQRLKYLNLFLILHIFFGDNAHAQNIAIDTNEIHAQVLANEVIEAMGGKQNFDETNFIGWEFFGIRKLIWDKKGNQVRVDYIKRQLTIITSLETDSTQLFMDGVEITHPDSLKKYSLKGKKIWANDSYWLLMPFKLLDDGVSLKYLQDIILNNASTAIVEMTFSNVGFTPLNKYWIYIDLNSKLVVQWVFYDNYADTIPQFSNAWLDYKKYGNILISGNRGEEGNLENIQVWDELPENVFEKL